MTLLDSFKNPVDPDKSFIIRASELPELRECQRKWFLQSHHGWNIEPIKKDKKLRFGSLWHKGLEEFYSTGSIDKAASKFAGAVEEEKYKLQETLGDLYSEKEEGIEDDLELGLKLLDAYPETAEQLTPPDSELEVIAIEHRFLIPIGKVNLEDTFDPPHTVYLSGKLDGIVRDSYGGIWGMEHKSMNKNADVTDPENLVLDLQTTVQIMLLKIYYHNAMGGAENVMGALYNLARKQQPGPRVKKEIFGRHKIMRNPTELRILHNIIMNQDVDMIKRWSTTRPERIPYNPQIFGRCSWGCGFREVCESMVRGEDIEHLLNSNYQKRDKDIYTTIKEEMEGQKELWEVS